MEGQSGVTRSIIDELYSSDIQGDQREGERKALLKESLVNLILGMSMEIKWKMKAGLLEASLMKFILGTSRETKWKMEAWCYSKYH